MDQRVSGKNTLQIGKVFDGTYAQVRIDFLLTYVDAFSGISQLSGSMSVGVRTGQRDLK